MDTAKPSSEVPSTVEALVIGFILAFMVGFISLLFIGAYAFIAFMFVLIAYLVYALYMPNTKPGAS
ncbi:MAG: hypothetical protein QXL94_02660 [Candidatus Parvarchaeum sp.]